MAQRNAVSTKRVAPPAVKSKYAEAYTKEARQASLCRAARYISGPAGAPVAAPFAAGPHPTFFPGGKQTSLQCALPRSHHRRTSLTICSMTGYAIHTRETPAGTITIELKSVNSRFLDLQFRVNDDLRSLEPALREAIIARVVRGKVECRLSFGRRAAVGGNQALNGKLLGTLADLQRQVRQQFADAAPLTVYELLRWPGVIEEAEISQDSLQEDVNSAMRAALDAFIESRAREGAALQEVLLSRVDAMEAIVLRIAPLVPQLVAQFQQRASERLQDALGLAHAQQNGTPNLTREETLERIRQEVTLYGIRIDIAEELARLSAHLAETRHILKKSGQVGKRLDFMMQELNREANTVGSKSAMKELADAAMELKLLIDQMREQVQNLE
jgi:uncharacterized protein (TIGR00255 family)